MKDPVRLLMVTGIEKRYSMDHYAEDLKASISSATPDLIVHSIKLTARHSSGNSFERIFFYIEKYIISIFRQIWLMKRYQIVHVADQSYGFLALVKLFLGRDTKFVVTVHDLIPLCYNLKLFGLKRPVRASIMYRFSIWCLRYCDALIFPSEFSARVYRKLNPNVKIRTYIIRHGCQLFEVSQSLAARNVRPRQNGSELHLGMVLGEAYKNHEFSFKVARYLAKRHQVKLSILGERTEEVTKTLDEFGLSQCVQFFTGLSKDQLVEFYLPLDVFLFPSEIEGLGMPFVEALLLGVPTFASDIPVLAEITNLKYPCFPAKDPQEIEQLLELSCDIEALSSLQTAGKYCARYFDWNVAGARVAQIYDAVLEG